jgi:glutamate dehydrogenase
VGIGDMSGDVFGNGMLLSRHIKLVAPLTIATCFLDPEPEPGVSFRERERLFALRGSSWDDYNKSLISKGWRRLPPWRQVDPGPRHKPRACWASSLATSPPQELMKAILRAPVDLLYNGGIGTYVKATSQTNGEWAIARTDAIRINGRGAALQGGGRRAATSASPSGAA